MSFGIAATQVGLMMALIALGWLLVKASLVHQSAVQGMTNAVIYLATPAVALQAFQRPFNPAQLSALGQTFALDVVVFAAMIGIVGAVFTRRTVPDGDHRAALRFGAVYSNSGFMGLPLVQALVGSDGVMFVMVFVAVFNLFVWTHGDAMMGRRRLALVSGLKSVVRTPALIATCVALVLFFGSWHLPSPASDLVGYLAGLNTPLSMLVVGANLYGIGIVSTIRDKSVWAGVGVRNVLIPLVFVAALAFVPIDAVARQATLIAVACPTAALLVMFSVRHTIAEDFSVRLLSLSTLASAVTLPALLALAAAVWGAV